MNTILFIITIFGMTPSAHFSSQESVLINHILTNYSKYTRPVINRTTPVVVTFGFNLIQVIDVVEKDQHLTCKIWMRMNWVNELIRWNPEKWDNITHFRLPPSELWKPDVFLQEDVGTDISSGPDKYKTPIQVYSSGKNQWLVPVKITSNCLINIKHFPFDEQICKLIFGSWTHDQSEIDLRLENKPIVTDIYVNSSEWNLMEVTRKIQVDIYPCCPNPFVTAEYSLRLQRKPLYYVYNIVLPCIVQMVIILFTFFLPPDSGERIGVVITVLLVFAVYLDVLSGSLPKTSKSVPALSKFYVTAMIESACSLIATCFVLNVHFKGTEKGVKPMPHSLRRYVLGKIGKTLGVIPNERQYTNNKILNALPKKSTNDIPRKLQEMTLNDAGIDNKSKPDKRKSPDDKNGINGFYSNISGLVKEVSVITSLVHDMNRQDEIEEEWQYLAKVMDRIFFILFLIIFVTSSVFILIPVYKVHH